MLDTFLEKLTPEQHDRFLDAVKSGLKSEGAKEVSLKLLTNRRLPRAKCPPCDKWFAIDEIAENGACPDCGHTGDFEVEVHPLYT